MLALLAVEENVTFWFCASASEPPWLLMIGGERLWPGSGVTRMVRFWLGPEGYGPLIDAVRRGEF